MSVDFTVWEGEWKFLCEYRGAKPELFDVEKNRGETKNIAGEHPRLVAKLTKECIVWHKSLPPDNSPQLAGNFHRNPAMKKK